MAASAKKDIITIGGSAGSNVVLRRLLSELPGDLPASLFISTHIPAHSRSLLPDILKEAAAMPIATAVDGQPIQPGHAYVAPPDRHLLLMNDTIRLGAGPRENMARPSIDPLFRSAALSYGSRVIGVVLSGMLNDGAAGLHAVKSVGGTTVVQHPLDAEADQMPLAALEAVEVDHVAPVASLPGLLSALVGTEAGPSKPASDQIRLEVEIAAGGQLGSRRLLDIAQPSPITCPDCHGVLSEVIDSRPLRFRCQIGHAYTADVVASMTQEVDEAIRVALRVMEERVTLVQRMALDARKTGRTAVAELYEARADEYSRYATTLREAAVAALRHASGPGSTISD